jgi:hypothetical protein
MLALGAVSVGASAATRGLGNIDTRCNDGHGLLIRAPHGDVSDLLTTETSTGVTIVGFDTVTPSDGTQVDPETYYAVGPDCRLDHRFGTQGIIRPRLPGNGKDLYVVGLAPGLDGHFFLLASGPAQWLIGEFNATGSLDVAFGSHGWVSLVPPGADTGYRYPYPQDLVQEPNGLIVVTGENARPHADVASFVYELFANGAVDRTFGHDGHARVLPEIAYADDLFVQPDGSIAVTGVLGGGGCFDMQINWLEPDGSRDVARDANFNRSRSFPSTYGFNGADFVDASGGVGVIGSEEPCGSTAATARSYDAAEALTPDGTVDRGFGNHGTTYFSMPNPAASDTSAVSLPNGDVILESVSGSTSYVQDFTSAGIPIRAFGHRDTLRIATAPAAWGYSASVLAGARGDFVVVFPANHVVTIEERLG